MAGNCRPALALALPGGQSADWFSADDDGGQAGTVTEPAVRRCLWPVGKQSMAMTQGSECSEPNKAQWNARDNLAKAAALETNTPSPPLGACKADESYKPTQQKSGP
ncbi:hypothetical protein GGTG_02801 [Gaeumannomyces tritici R3-111a-1]|uniref:Uncharacterized protein n=1 Tax=Gaeumannomyces tritici (strain R3-111a-1) TaxID=644352 RepID=J3NNE5_GAET3|nr:hypothetical protein GGTG_02801 [Gaeumannomyces tritici R3-111a-1]EJT77697.1 hypothetical protein GGTG_02801 [Gaeumannomyces tritici R3-111a-1]